MRNVITIILITVIMSFLYAVPKLVVSNATDFGYYHYHCMVQTKLSTYTDAARFRTCFQQLQLLPLELHSEYM